MTGVLLPEQFIAELGAIRSRAIDRCPHVREGEESVAYPWRQSRSTSALDR